MHRKVLVYKEVITQNIVEPKAQNQGRVLFKDLYVDIQQNDWSGTLPRRKKCYCIGIDLNERITITNDNKFEVTNTFVSRGFQRLNGFFQIFTNMPSYEWLS